MISSSEWEITSRLYPIADFNKRHAGPSTFFTSGEKYVQSSSLSVRLIRPLKEIETINFDL